MSDPEQVNADFRTSYQQLEFHDAELSHALFADWQDSAIDQNRPHQDRIFQAQTFRNIIEVSTAAQGHPQDRHAIEAFGKIVDYFWFGSPYSPLPRGLTRYRVMGSSPTIALNYDQITDNEMQAATAMLRPLGLGRLTDYRTQLFARQAEHVLRPLVTGVVANTPGYRLLESFSVSRRMWHERPLTPEESLARERAFEQTIRHRHRIPEDAGLSAYPAARTELARAVQNLDEATRYEQHTASQAGSPAERAAAFFKKIVAGQLGKDMSGTSIHSMRTEYVPIADDTSQNTHSPHGGIRITTDRESAFCDTESLITWAESQGYLSHPSNTRLSYISANIINLAVLRLFEEDSGHLDYGNFLQGLLNMHATELTDQLEHFATAKQQYGQLSALGTLLLAPSEADVEIDSPCITFQVRPELTAHRQLTSGEYRRANRHTLGHIKKRPRTDRSARVIQYVDMSADLPHLDRREADLILQLRNPKAGLLPTIPGYSPTGYDAQRNLFGFAYTPEADPYTECAALIPDDARTTLTQIYADIGMNELAALVHSTSGLTVGQLARDIARINAYSFAQQKQRSSHIPETLAGYAGQTQGGRLHGQCVDASYFLCHTLQAVFGSNSSSVIAGDSLPGLGRRISGVGHQQTTFVDPETNRSHILDATSEYAGMIGWRDAVSRHVDLLRRAASPGVLRRSVQPSPPTAIKKQPAAHPEELEDAGMQISRAAMLEQNKDSLIMQLRVIFGASGRPLPRDELIEMVATQPSDDLIFRTLSTVILSLTERANPDEPQHVLRYLRALKNCNDPELLHRIDPLEYTKQPRLVHALETALTELTRLST